MQERRYLLNIGSMLEGSGRDALFREAFDRTDGERRQKVLSYKSVRAQAAGIGAGLLIQKALADYQAESQAGRQMENQEEPQADWRPGDQEEPQCFSVEELLSALGRDVIEPHYRYGKNGKPYLADYPFQFNLSHSGDYVFCGVSEQEIGVDIQKIQGDYGLRLAKRFFAGPECQALEACRDEELRRRMFIRMWVRKEAYGKLTGEGIAGTVGKCLWRDIPAGEEISAGAAERYPLRNVSEGEEISAKAAGKYPRRDIPEGEEISAGAAERYPGRNVSEGEEISAKAAGKYPRRDIPEGEELSGCNLPGKGLWWEKDLIWEEYDVPDGYRMAVCRFRRKTAPG